MIHHDSFKMLSNYRIQTFGDFTASNPDDAMGKSQNYTSIDEMEKSDFYGEYGCTMVFEMG